MPQEQVFQAEGQVAEQEATEQMEVPTSSGSFLVEYTGEIPPPRFSLNFIWLEKVLCISVDQVFGKGQRAPITDYFQWPQVDAWEELRLALEERKWISEVDQILIMNRCTEVINFWQEEGTFHTKEEAEAKFEDCLFLA
eukprot:TRINITY_DN4378_c0_g2_i1.p1 TRINITY_DN4378_c0_g2~~TRINITY_DN4378_c0_g2_i1.p1  ORF type:complete len:139 (-),score=16.66 TRINITY_DN4378_c0_g2_i1:31-447(-)